MRNRILVPLISGTLLLLSGCNVFGPYEIGAGSMLSLDRALVAAKSNDHYYVSNLWHLWAQAPTEDKVIIETEMLAFLLRYLEVYGERGGQTLYDLRRLGQQATNEEVKAAAAKALLQYEQARALQAEQRREAQELEEQKEAEKIRLALKESRQRLIREAGGRLDDKPAEEVKRLVDGWRREQALWFWSPELDRDDRVQFFRAGDFYTTFGQPRQKQLIGSSYYFYYQCTDGTVQMEVNADSLDEGYVFVSDLNIL